MRVECEVEYVPLEGDNGRQIDGVVVTCSRCGEERESYGDGEKSIRRCFVLLREYCPKHEANFYVSSEE